MDVIGIRLMTGSGFGMIEIIKDRIRLTWPWKMFFL